MVETLIWRFFSYFGDIAYWIGFTIASLIVYPLLEKRDRKKMGWILTELIPIVLVSYVVVLGLKFLFQVPRSCPPEIICPTTPSFPSGHAAIAFAFATVIAIKLKRKIYFLFFGLAFLVALSRIMLMVHTPSDVIAGAILGTSIAWVGLIVKKIKLQRFYLRKIVHLSILAILPIEFFLGKNIAVGLTLAIFLVYATSEIFRMRRKNFPFIQNFTKALAYREEIKGIVTSPLYLAAGILTLLILFPPSAFYAGVIAAIIGDSMAGVFGKRFGKRRNFYNEQKSLEGSIACFFSVFLTLLIFFAFPKALFLAILAALVESIFVKYENFVLPVSVGILCVLI